MKLRYCYQSEGDYFAMTSHSKVFYSLKTIAIKVVYFLFKNGVIFYLFIVTLPKQMNSCYHVFPGKVSALALTGVKL